MVDTVQILCSSPLFAGLTPQEVQEALLCLKSAKMEFAKDTLILRAGDATDKLGVVLSGSVLVVQEDCWGNRNILSVFEKGETFAETYACVPNAILNVNVVAREPCCVLFVDAERILHVCSAKCARHSRLIDNILSILALKNLRQSEKLHHLGQRTTRAKLLSYLSMEAQRAGSLEFDIPYSRQQLADYLFVERSGLSSELGKMRNEGLLDFTKNHFILRTAPKTH